MRSFGREHPFSHMIDLQWLSQACALADGISRTRYATAPYT